MGLVVVESQQFGRPEVEHLADDLGADGAARPGDQDPFAGQQLGDLAQVGGDRLAGEQVGQFQIADVLERAAGTQHVAQVGDDPEPDVDRHAPVDQISQVIVGERGGNDHLVDSEHFHDGRHVDQSAEYREAGQAPVRRVSICR